MSLVYIYMSISVGVLILALIVSSKKQHKPEPQMDWKQIEKVYDLVEQKTQELVKLQNEIYNRTLIQPVNLTRIENDVLDIYDKSNIRIPVDILEDLSNMNLSDEKDIINFIESQRKYWKLENSKDVFIRKEVK